MSKYLVFSHGFGVKKDSRGMFTDIAKAFPGYESVMFDYNEINETDNTVTVRSLSEQAKILQIKIQAVQNLGQNPEIYLVSHSQGCVVAALAHLSHIKKTVLLAPPGSVSSARVNEHFGKRPGVTIEKDGTIRVPRKDGSTTRITKEFIDGLSKIDAIDLYAKLASKTPTTIIIAKEDEMLRPIDFSSLPKSVDILKIDGDHNFTGKSRAGLIQTLKTILN